MNRKFKDSVFTYLFSDPKYMRELYLYLHTEDHYDMNLRMKPL